MPKLMIDEGGQASVFELFEDEIMIGRGASNAIQVADGHASKYHAAIRLVGGRPKLVDLESKNGTKVNGEFKNQRWLEHGDTVSIGAAVLTFDASDVGPAAPSVRGAAVSRAAPARAAAPAAAAALAATALPPLRSAAQRARDRQGRSRDDDGDEDEGPRAPARRGSNSAMIALGMGVGVLGLIGLLFLMLSHSGTGKNAEALMIAKQKYSRGHTEEAYNYLVKNSDPTDEDGYRSVKVELDAWKKELANVGSSARETEAADVYRKIEFDWVEKWKNKLTKEGWKARLRDFLTQYKGTLQATQMLGSPYGDYPKMRQEMDEQQAWEALKSIRDDWTNRKEKGFTESELGARLLKFQSEFQGTLELDELLTSGNDPYPDFRRLMGAK